MPAKSLAVLLPAIALLTACYSSSSYPPRSTVVEVPPSKTVVVAPPTLPGALGAPATTTTSPPLSGSSVPVMSSPPLRLSAGEVSAALAGNTAQGVSANGLPYAAYFSPGGEERFREGEFTDYGNWYVLPDGRLCSTLRG
jgi:hypothetical protein